MTTNVPPARPSTVRQGDADFAARYRAMASRDSRFDGQFVSGVTSTGIYCRPSCPAVTPKPGNVVFFRTSAAAHDSGLRACRRCQPDAAPGSPVWNLDDDLAARAMRLIADGVVTRAGVAGLADRLGYTPRHLTRVLTRELGAGPLALARAHRAHTAHVLLASTTLPIADVAFAAGFASIRQFNATIAAVYERTPTQLRGRVKVGDAVSASGDATDGCAATGTTGTTARTDATTCRTPTSPPPGSPTLTPTPTSTTIPTKIPTTTLTLRLPARAPFDGAGIFRFLADHAIAGVEVGTASAFARRIRLPQSIAEVQLRLDTTAPPNAPAVLCTARLTHLGDMPSLVTRVRRLLDLDADSVAIDDALGADLALRPSVLANPGIRLPGSIDAHETLIRTLVGQQVSVVAARTTLGRMCAELCGDSGLFPTADQLADSSGIVRGPASRVRTILGAAEALASGSLVLDVGMPLAEFEAQLIALPGIGPWTAGYVAMRVLGAPDVLLSSDLIMLRSAEALGLPFTAKSLTEHGAAWAPWRSYAGLHLWRSIGR